MTVSSMTGFARTEGATGDLHWAWELKSVNGRNLDIRARLPVSQVVARKVALKKKGREYAGLSPFKVEKTPSFFVNDQKGFYHCFASGEHGDIFKFVMATEGLTFPEAVERLAAEAGLPMPRPSERDTAAEDARQRLYALLDAAARFFEDALQGPTGAEARRYVEKRGLRRATADTFRLGFAPASRSAVMYRLAKLGFTSEAMAGSGMLIAGDDIPVAYDRFRNRVMFPIADLKGRTIAFGGRALDPDAPAKYLNSPETPLFHKGHVLFNAHRARPAAHDKGRVIAVEGYMDVAALHEAGFPETVAPLGTALTEDQLKLLWRMAPEPILCFDGDAAGRRAAFRAVETALPHLRAGRSVQFVFLPDGADPDDLVRQRGPAGLTHALAGARPLVDVVWERELAAGPVDTPERRAAFEHRLEQLVLQIRDRKVQALYRRDIRDRLWRWRKDEPRSRPAQTSRSVASADSAATSAHSVRFPAGDGVVPAVETWSAARRSLRDAWSAGAHPTRTTAAIDARTTKPTTRRSTSNDAKWGSCSGTRATSSRTAH